MEVSGVEFVVSRSDFLFCEFDGGMVGGGGRDEYGTGVSRNHVGILRSDFGRICGGGAAMGRGDVRHGGGAGDESLAGIWRALAAGDAEIDVEYCSVDGIHGAFYIV